MNDLATFPVLTIDGPGGAGKGTISAAMARKFSWHLLDSGALYRLVALGAQHHRIALDDEAALAGYAAQLDVHFDMQPDGAGVEPRLEGEAVGSRLRTEDCGRDASKVAALPAVRQALLQRQRDFLRAPGLVADGRDMGTVVFPAAEAKIFLTASVEERAQRRYKQLIEKGNSANLPDLLKDIGERDARDTQRSIAPLKPATDAMLLDTSGLSIDEVVEIVARFCQQQFP